MSSSLSSLEKLRLFIEQQLQEAVSSFGERNLLKEACGYALLAGGKRFRPLITLLVADALKKNASVIPAALAVEFFHTASLVADDLPCMDDDDERRNIPSTHKKHGEAIALLASYGLIAAGYEGIAKNGALLKTAGLEHSTQSDRICVLALENATYNTGLCGATGGQFLDVCPPNSELGTVFETIHKKTVSLFEIAFVFGWLFGGGDLKELPRVKEMASCFGLAFQIADDLGDMEQDVQNGRLINIANLVGSSAAVEMFHAEIAGYNQKLKELQIDTPELKAIADQIDVMVNCAESDVRDKKMAVKNPDFRC